MKTDGLNDVSVADAVRTPAVTYGGALSGIRRDDLAARPGVCDGTGAGRAGPRRPRASPPSWKAGDRT